MKLVRDPQYGFLYQDPITGTYYVRKTEKGRKPLFRSTRESKSKGRAKEKALDIIAEWKGEVRINEGAILFDEIAKIVLNNKKNLRKNTRHKYLDQFKVLMPYFGDMRVDQIDEGEWEKFIFYRNEQRPGASFATTRAVLLDVINRAFERKLLERKPKLRNPDRDREMLKRIFTRAEVLRMIRRAPTLGVRHAISLAYFEAFRRGDVINLSWNRIDFERGTLAFTKDVTKNKKSRVIPLSAKSLRILRRRRRLVGSISPWVFPMRGDPTKHALGFSKGFEQARDAAGIVVGPNGARGRFHDLRRTALTEMFGRHPNHLKVCYVRDISVETAMREYVRWSIDDLREVSR